MTIEQSNIFLINLLSQNFSCFTYLPRFKCLFRNDKKRTAVEIQMKKMRAFNHSAESFPRPASAAPLIFNKHMLVFKAYFKPVFESGRFTINNSREHIPEGYH